MALILVVDDEAHIRELLRLVSPSMGVIYRVRVPSDEGSSSH